MVGLIATGGGQGLSPREAAHQLSGLQPILRLAANRQLAVRSRASHVPELPE